MLTDLQGILVFVLTAVWHVWPAFLLSVLLGVLIKALKLDGFIRSAFNAHIGLSILLATVVGAFSPFCSCTVVPIISGLLLSGVPLAPVMAFWIASPTMDPEIFALSVATLGWQLAMARLLATLTLSLGAGFLALALSRAKLFTGSMLRQQAQPEPLIVPPTVQPALAAANGLLIPLTATSGGSACGVSFAERAPQPQRWYHRLAANWQALDWPQIGRDVARQSWQLGRWLLLAFLLEALILRYVPQGAIAGLLGGTSWLAIPLAALIGVPLYLSNVTALPIVSGLLAQGMQPGAAIAFLIAGPVTTIPAMTAVWGIVRREVFALYLAVGLFGAMLMGLLTNLFLR